MSHEDTLKAIVHVSSYFLRLTGFESKAEEGRRSGGKREKKNIEDEEEEDEVDEDKEKYEVDEERM